MISPGLLSLTPYAWSGMLNQALLKREVPTRTHPTERSSPRHLPGQDTPALQAQPEAFPTGLR